MVGERISHFTIVIGAAKCGTTSLFRYLEEHPQVAASRTKEPNFFASEEHFLKGRAWYQGLWDFRPREHRTALEATTACSVYPVYPSAPERMASFSDVKFKLIYMIRDPLEQIASNYTQAYTMGSAWVDPSSGWWSGPRINRFFLACASYAQQIDEYRRFFAREDICLLALEDLKRDPDSVLEKVCRFIEIDPTYEFRHAGDVINPSEGKVLRSRHWTRLRAITSLRACISVAPLKSQGDRLRRFFGSTATGRIELTEDDKETAVSNLRSDWLRLRDEYGFDISKWKVPL